MATAGSLQRINSPSPRLAPAAPRSVRGASAASFINSSALLSLPILLNVIDFVGYSQSGTPSPRPHRSRASHSKRLGDFPRVEQQHLTGNFRPFNSSMDQQDSPIPIASSSNGRISGKPWKLQKTPTVCVLHTFRLHICYAHRVFSSRSHLQPALKSRGFHDRMEKATKAQAVKKLQAELKEEKQTEIQR